MTAALPNLADPMRIAAGVLADVYTPRVSPPVDVWCERHRRLVTEGAGSARSGAWETDRTPYLRQIFRDMTRPTVREITVKKSSQIGFSELLIGGVLYTLAERRRPVLVGYPTYDEARDFNRKRLIPALRACEPCASLIGSDRDITESELRLRGAVAWFSWAHSTKTFKSDPVADIFLDEIDEYPPGGGVLSNARDRQRTFERRLLVKGSTPEDDEAEGFISREYESAAHRFRFVVPCPITGGFFELYHFDLLRWPGGRNADPDAAARSCWLQSPLVNVARHRIGDTTEGRINETWKRWMVMHGLWIRQGEAVESDGRILEAGDDPPVWLSRIDADWLREPPRHGRMARLAARAEPDAAARAAMELGVRIVGGDEGAAGRIAAASHVAYRVNSMASLIDAEGWGGIVRRGLAERFGADWSKGTMGQAPKIRGDVASVRHLADRCTPAERGGYTLGTLPEGTAFVAVGVDVQKVCVYAAAVAFGDPATDPALVWAARIARDERLAMADVSDDLASLRFAVGDAEPRVRPVFIGVDSGFWTEHVYDLCRDLRRAGVHAWATKGEGGTQSRAPFRLRRVREKDERDRETGRIDPVLFFHADTWKTVLYGLIAEEPDRAMPAGAEPVMLRLPEPWMFDDGRVSGDQMDFLHQITAERRVRRLVAGREVFRWEKKRDGLANHYLDCVTQALAGARFRGVDRLTADAVAAARKRAAGPSGRDEETPAAPAPKPSTPATPARTRTPAQTPTSIAKRMLTR